ncbi:hypothetical protein ACFSM5_00665 [Lacibacterium aquatile]|uniref:Uncharacterized protein n=1 Tax=Lacibacterium aquatile TaxID=1168082 RepID=A0ABW5DLL1_9PROT
MKRVLFCVLALTCASEAQTATPLEAYLAKRDRLIEEIDREATSHDSDAVLKKNNQGLAELKPMLQNLIGSAAIEGFAPEGQLHLETLIKEQGFGKLDGFYYEGTDSGRSTLVISTQALLQTWLDSDPERPKSIKEALRLDKTYTYALSTDSGFTSYAELPVVLPDGQSTGAALLGLFAQDSSPEMPQTIILSLLSGDRVFMLQTNTAVPVAPIPACSAAGKATEEASRRAFEAYNAAKNKDPKQLDTIWALEEQAHKEMVACITRELPTQPYFPALVVQTQKLVDSLLR